MFSGLESPMHLLVVLVIAMLVFGPKRLPELGRSLGSGVRGFKAAIDGEEEPPKGEPTKVPVATAAAKPTER